MKRLLVSMFVALPLLATSQANFDTVRIRPVKVTEQIYMLKGSGGNIGVMIGRDGTFVIDDQYAPLSNKINGAIKTLDPGEIRFIVNTHIHGDHSGGNENFKRMGVTIIAHDVVRDRMQKEQVIKQLNRNFPIREKDALPVITFADKMNFHLNDEDIILHHFDRAHTDGDVIVQFKNANVIHTGDAFVRYGYPFIDLANGGSMNGFISTLDKILSLADDNTKIIPGHGELATKADVKILRDMVADIRDKIVAALKKGTKSEDMANLDIIAKYEEQWGKGFVKGKDFLFWMAEDLKTTVKSK